MADSSYVIKRVDFFGRTVKICMQNMNGPCPLLAIANVLSLRNELKLPAGIRQITQADLITAIVDLLLERSKHYETSAAHAADYQQSISDIFPVLQKLTTGIDVNVKFHNVHAFEPTPEVAVFDLLGIPLVHGWLADPQDSLTAAVFGNKSYNELMEVMLAGLDESEVEALSAGPLRNLSIQHSSFSATHNQQQQAAADAAVQQQQQQHELRGGQLEAAAKALDKVLPMLPSISTTGSKALATAAAAAPGAEQAAASLPAHADDAVIEQLVEDMLQLVCCDNMPDKIELGDSPTHSMSLTRRLAYEGAGPSRLSSSSTKGAAAMAAAAAAAAVAQSSGAGARAHGATASSSSSSSSQQQQDKGRAAADAHVVRHFMESHCSQLTPYGLSSLGESLKEHQLAVFFRNNHFNTLFKYEDGIYLLVTDQGYECEPDIVWERLDSVNGDTTYCTGAFTAFVPHRDPNAALTFSQVASGEGALIAAGQNPHPSALTDYDAAIAASLAAESGGDLHMNPNFDPRYGGGGNGAGRQHAHHQRLTPEEHHEDADFALALQLQLQEEEAARAAAEQRQQQQGGIQQQQQQPGGRVPQQQQAHQQQFSQQLQQQGESLAASVRHMGRRLASGVERTAMTIQQQAAQLAAPEYAGQQQQHGAPAHGQHRRTAVHAAGAGRRRQQQQDEKCSIM